MNDGAAPPKLNGQGYNLLALPRVDRPAQVRTFTDPAYPGLEVTLSLRRPGPIQQAEIRQLEAEEVGRWVEGDPVEGRPPVPFIVGDEPIMLHPRFIGAVCLIYGMQTERRYTLHELYGLFLRAEDMWLEVDAWVGSVLRERGTAEPGKSSGTPPASSSSLGSSTSTPTPASSSAPTASSGASTSG